MWPVAQVAVKTFSPLVSEPPAYLKVRSQRPRTVIPAAGHQFQLVSLKMKQAHFYPEGPLLYQPAGDQSTETKKQRKPPERPRLSLTVQPAPPPAMKTFSPVSLEAGKSSELNKALEKTPGIRFRL